MSQRTILSSHGHGTCRPGSPATCSFLLMGPRGWACAKTKGNDGLFIQLLQRRLDGTIKAMGNNCNGIDPDPEIPLIENWPGSPGFIEQVGGTSDAAGEKK